MKSAIGIGALLMDGLGDTIRVSLTEDPEYEIDPCKRLATLGETACREVYSTLAAVLMLWRSGSLGFQFSLAQGVSLYLFKISKWLLVQECSAARRCVWCWSGALCGWLMRYLQCVLHKPVCFN